MDLKDRLEKISQLQEQINKITSSSKKKSQNISQDKGGKIEEILSGRFIETPFGESFVVENFFPIDYLCGETKLSDIFSIPIHYLSQLLGDEQIKQMDFKKTVFLDTETTGLAGGTGTFAFLVGLGYFTDNQFCVKQYFMRDFDEEPALLDSLNELLSHFESIVTYNGKAFDMPLMESRFIMSGMQMNLSEPLHLDLLYPVRRLWKKRLENCSLSTVERDLLNIYRENDIPGYLVPAIYFRYLQSRNASELKGVFDHNLQDILSLVALTIKINEFLKNPLNAGYFPVDIYSLGKIFDTRKEYVKSTFFYNEVLKFDLPNDQLLETLKSLSFAYKRQNKWKEAEKIWKEAIDKSYNFLYYPYEELAKYYEHHIKDYKKAISIVEAAMSMAENDILKEKLEYRLNRIKNKFWKNG